MSTRSIVLVSGGVALLVLGVILIVALNEGPQEEALGGHAGEGGSGLEKPVDADTAAGARAGVDDPIETEIFRDPARAEAKAGWIVRGRVRAGGGPPPAGSRVRARLYAGMWERSSLSPAREPILEKILSVGDTGSFAWGLPPPKRVITLSLRAEAARHHSRRTVEELILVHAPPPGDIILELAPLDAFVNGAVTNTEKEALPGAQVAWRGHRVATDARGEYRLPVASGLSHLRVAAYASGYGSQTRRAAPPRPGKATRLDFVLGPALTVHGVVTDVAGTPIQGVTLVCWQDRAIEEKTGVDGAYEISGLPRGKEDIGIYARAPGFALKSIYLQKVNSAKIRQDIVLERGLEVTGTIIDENGATVKDARVGIGWSFDEVRVLKSLTDEEGRFSFSDAPAGRTSLLVFKQGFAPVKRGIELSEDPATRTDITGTLRRGSVLNGRVVDQGGAPVNAIRIAVKKKGDYVEGGARTDVDGLFKLEGLLGQEVELELYGQGIERLWKTVPVGGSEVTLVVRRHGRLAGRVVDDDTGAPLSVFQIRFVTSRAGPGEKRGSGYASELSSKGLQFSDTDGYFKVDTEELKSGAIYSLEATSDGYARGLAARLVASTNPDRDEVVIRLKKASRLGGTVTLKGTDSAVARAHVRWVTRTELEHVLGFYATYDSLTREMAGLVTDNPNPGAVLTDGSGAYEFTDITPGEVFLIVRHVTHPTHVEGPVIVPATGLGICSIEILPGASLVCTVKDSAGKLQIDAKVNLSPDGGRGIGEPSRKSGYARTGSDGSCRFDGLAAGSYRVSWMETVGRGSVTVLSTRIEVPATGIARATLMPAGDCRLVVEVSWSQPLPDDLTVQAIPVLDPAVREAGRRRAPRAAIVRQGVAVINGLEAGAWRINASRPFGSASPSASTQVTLGAASERRVTLTLE